MPLGDMTRDHYDRHAHEHTATWAGQTGPAVSFARRHTRWKGVGPVLDLGCGGGRDTKVFAEAGWQVAAVDLSETMARLVEAGNSHRARGWGGVLVGDATRLPLATGSMAAVWSSAGLVHLTADKMLDALQEITRVTVTGGPVELTVKHTGDGMAAGSAGRDDQGRWYTMWQPADLACTAERVGVIVDRVDLEADTARSDTIWCRLRGVRGIQN